MLEIFIRELLAGWNYFWRKTRDRAVSKIAESVFHNTDIIASFEAAKATLAFERKFLREVPTFKTRKQLFKYCFETAQSPDAGYRMPDAGRPELRVRNLQRRLNQHLGKIATK